MPLTYLWKKLSKSQTNFKKVAKPQTWEQVKQWLVIPPLTLIGGGLRTPSCSAADCVLRGREGFELGIVIFNGFLTGGFGTYPDNIGPLALNTVLPGSVPFIVIWFVIGWDCRWEVDEWDFVIGWWFVSGVLIGSFEETGSFLLWDLSRTCKQKTYVCIQGSSSMLLKQPLLLCRNTDICTDERTASVNLKI